MSQKPYYLQSMQLREGWLGRMVQGMITQGNDHNPEEDREGRE